MLFANLLIILCKLNRLFVFAFCTLSHQYLSEITKDVICKQLIGFSSNGRFGAMFHVPLAQFK